VSRARTVVLTPGVAGANGIAEVTRLVVRALEAEDDGLPTTVLSIDRGPRGASPVASDRASAVAGGARFGPKLRFAAAALGAVTAGADDVVCLHVHLSPVARLVARGRARLTVFLHGVEAWRPLGRAERWALAGADVLMANSAHTVERFREANRALAARPIDVCHLGVDPIGVDPAVGADAAGGPEAAGPFALIVGRLAAAERYKGHDLLIDLWPEIARRVPSSRLVVAGDGDDRARLEARAAHLGDRVRFLGHVSPQTLASVYRDALFFVMPSRAEGFGLVFLEAMRAGKACIGALGAAAEIIEHGVTGLVVDPSDPGEVVEAVVRLFREGETREQMGKAGAARLAAHFTEAHFRRRFGAILARGAR